MPRMEHFANGIPEAHVFHSLSLSTMLSKLQLLCSTFMTKGASTETSSQRICSLGLTTRSYSVTLELLSLLTIPVLKRQRKRLALHFTWLLSNGKESQFLPLTNTPWGSSSTNGCVVRVFLAEMFCG